MENEEPFKKNVLAIIFKVALVGNSIMLPIVAKRSLDMRYHPKATAVWNDVELNSWSLYRVKILDIT